MDFKEIVDNYLFKIKEHYLPLLLMFVGFILLSGGLIYSLRSSGSKNEVTFEPASSVQNNESKIAVDVEGAVITPGVYSLNSSFRIKDALIAAGGLSSSADRIWVEKNINLASKLVDGIKIYVPRLGDSMVISKDRSVNNSLLNINSASLSELDGLSGIGIITAQKIIDGRPYNSINDLVSKKIVKSSVFEKIKDKVSVY